MPREANLFEQTGGSVVEAFLLLRAEGKNIPPNRIERAKESRKSREKSLAKLLEENCLDGLQALRDWELAYRKESFYRGMWALFDLQRQGRTKL